MMLDVLHCIALVVDGCIDIRNIIYQHCVSVDEELNSYWVARFMKDWVMLRDTVRLGHLVTLFYGLKKNFVV